VHQNVPIDLDQVTSRLDAISSRQDTSPRFRIPSNDRASSVETLPPDPPENYERESYNELVGDGGQPLYPIDRIDEVAQDPLSHWDMLRPWLKYEPDFKLDPHDCID
jgi:hypothetical protein